MLRKLTIALSAWVIPTPILLLAACSGGSGPSSTQEEESLTVADTSVSAGEVVRLNQPIDIHFSKDIDFSSVNSNTINIATPDGLTATGTFKLLANGRSVRFQPNCPTQADNSDAGFKAGGETYRILVLGKSATGPTVVSLNGEAVQTSFAIEFVTPDSDDPGELFLDTVAGAPTARIRGRDGVALDEPSATYLELGGEADMRLYFVWNPTEQVAELEGDSLAPLNFYSKPNERVAILLSLNQPINPSTGNLNTQVVQLEYQDENEEWVGIPTVLSLDANCTETGAALRLEPVGLLPQGSGVRAVIRAGFSDLTGSKTVLDADNLAKMNTETVYDPGTTTPGLGVDEVLESFATKEREDELAPFDTPPAEWGDNKLAASFPFGGTGGPNGNFDWYIPPGTDIVIDTTSATITGGPGGDPTTIQQVINGVIDIRSMFLPANSSVIIQGPNICTILATGFVRIDGVITISGASHEGVGTLNTTNQPEPGAAGNAGGGKGGTGSYLTTQSTPRGGTGFGAFNAPNGGGQGGETSYSDGGIVARRSSGGGGGSFGPDAYYSFGPGFTELVRCQEYIGMDAEHGHGGGREPGKGAESQTQRARGGDAGPRPFLDGDDSNDFLGTMLTADGNLIRGELDRVWGGAGGGAGGDSVDSDSFPLIPFTNTGDEKGAGGGGAAGGLRILALGQIEIREPNGRILAEGGQGGGGENPNTGGFSRVGGGSGGGSGGHIVLSSASYISVAGLPTNAGEWFNDYLAWDAWDDHGQRMLSAVGGQGGAGRNNKGGSNFNGNRTTFRCDSIPLEYFGESTGGGLTHNPPRDDEGNNSCWNSTGLPDLEDPDGLGPVLAAGGDGGPGIIQLHVDDPALNLRFPDASEVGQVYGEVGALGIDVSKVSMPAPVGWKAAYQNVASDLMIPFFGKESTAQSLWIALGLARVNPLGGFDQVEFFFNDVDTDTGAVLHDGDRQARRDPVLGPVTLATGPALPFIDVDDPLTITLDASDLSVENEIYKRNSQLLRLFVLQLGDSLDPETTQEHEVASASYDAASDQLRLTVFPRGGKDLRDFLAGGDILVSLIPLQMLVETDGERFGYPEDAEIAITFQATTADAEGNPDTDAATPLVTDITDLNLEQYDFFRFRVRFNLSSSGQQVTADTPRPSLDFMRIPFRF